MIDKSKIDKLSGFNPILLAKLKLLHDIHDGTEEIGKIEIDPLINNEVKGNFETLKTLIGRELKYKNSEPIHLKALSDLRDTILSDI